MSSKSFAALWFFGVLGCGAVDDSDPAASRANGDAWAVTEEWLDSCRQWCGMQAVLKSGPCERGEAIVRGVPLGEPLPDAVAKSYDLECIDECLAVRAPKVRCWQQTAEMNECLANDAIFVCLGDEGWEVKGCMTAGSDPSVCDLP